MKVYDVCEVNGQMAIVMEYIEGQSLSTLLKQSPLGGQRRGRLLLIVQLVWQQRTRQRPTHPNTVGTDTP